MIRHLAIVSVSVITCACSSSSGSSQPGDPGAIQCGPTAQCAAGQECQTTYTASGVDWTQVSCVPSGTTVGALTCDDKADCAPDQVCCLHIQGVSLCKTTCDGDNYLIEQLCTSSSECPSPTTCVPSQDPSAPTWLKACL